MPIKYTDIQTSLWQPYDYASLNIQMTPTDFQYGFTFACYE